MKVQHAGERRKISLKTPIKAAAVAKARDIYVAILAGGWEQALRLHRPERAAAKTEVTVGQFLEELKAKADLNPGTLKGYASAFRSIVADIFGIEGGKEKYDYRSGGRNRWTQKINAVRLTPITPERVIWKRAFIARAGEEIHFASAVPGSA
jgi:hypothetical protein